MLFFKREKTTKLQNYCHKHGKGTAIQKELLKSWESVIDDSFRRTLLFRLTSQEKEEEKELPVGVILLLLKN